jgi:Homeodomain-like domain
LDISTNTVARIRRQLVEEGFEAVLTAKRSPNSSNTKIFDGESEAKLIALACSAPPKGRAKWTLRLLEEKAVELEIVDCVSDNTIGRCLKNLPSGLTRGNILKPHLQEQWVIPPDSNAAFVAGMEDILEVYQSLPSGLTRGASRSNTSCSLL